MRVAFLLAALLAIPTSVFAQTKQSGMPKCDGDIAIVRVSQIKPGGSMKGFMDAVAAHLAWYRANGITENVIAASRVLVKDAATGGEKYSTTEVITYHIRPPANERIPHQGDAAWKAYQKQYSDNAEIKSEYLTCMPKLTP